ncbi:MAG: nucleotidyltransferase family protein [Bacillota bacterium]|nr:nucleotidyltransferase family protein [Bacillota bacterium]
MFENENIFILELCKFKTYDKNKLKELIEKSLDYPYILGQLLFNRVGGVAYYVLKECNLLSKLNREFRNSLKAIYDSNTQKTNSFLISLEDLSEMFKSADFNYALLKGSYLVYLYEKGLRTSNDFDILINQEDITKLSNVLKENGFVQGYIRNEQFIPATRTEIISSRMNRGETVPFIKTVDLPQMKFCEIDINFSLDFKAKQENDAVKNILKRSEELISTKTGNLFTLSASDFLIQLCVHLFKEASIFNWVEMGRDLSIYKFMDIYLFITLFMNNKLASELEKTIFEFDLHNECYYSFLYAKQLFGIENADFDELIKKIQPNDLSYLNQIISPSDGNVYAYDMDFESWLFFSKRKEQLYEVKHD